MTKMSCQSVSAVAIDLLGRYLIVNAIYRLGHVTGL